MRVATFRGDGGLRLGVVRGEQMIDVARAADRLGLGDLAGAANDMLALIAGGDEALQALAHRGRARAGRGAAAARSRRVGRADSAPAQEHLLCRAELCRTRRRVAARDWAAGQAAAVAQHLHQGRHRRHWPAERHPVRRLGERADRLGGGVGGHRRAAVGGVSRAKMACGMSGATRSSTMSAPATSRIAPASSGSSAKASMARVRWGRGL